MSDTHILLVISEAETRLFLERTVLSPAGYFVSSTADWNTAESILQRNPPDMVVLSEQIDGRSCLEKARLLFQRFPFTPVCLLVDRDSEITAIQAVRLGFYDCWQVPLKSAEILQTVERALAQRQRWLEQVRLKTRQGTSSLEERMNALEAIQRIGRKVTSMLDLDSILSAVVDAAVEITNAEEGSLLLVDEMTGEFYMRAASQNFQQEYISSFRLPIHDPLLAEVLKTGKPVVVDGKTPQKIKTSYLVHTLIYAPLIVQERVIGVLEVDHRQSGKSFSEQHIMLMSALADYSAIAIENARLYARTESERKKLESILTGIEEAVIVVDEDRRLALINRKAREAFGIPAEASVYGRRAREVIQHPDLLDILFDSNPTMPTRAELTLDDGRVLNAQITPLKGIGLVISMQDITYLKELDRIKSDFVHTVSHDLRSPLTAILGYVELIDRVGPVNDQQREFIHRVQVSVQNITALINDLLDLGRIEAGFDTRKEVVQLSTIAQYAIDGFKNRLVEKSLELQVDIPDDLPKILGNPVRLRQMLNNLIGNAHKYTPEGGCVSVKAHAEGGQVILQVSDNGPGIPPADQPYIFDKFYRASNVPADTPGTGLGLAIVKSIVENHLGRVWVDSTLGKGTTFTIVLPAIDSAF
jgi:two-component system NtrC family sensor kinase